MIHLIATVIIAIALHHAWHRFSDSDGRRMAETAQTGSGSADQRGARSAIAKEQP